MALTAKQERFVQEYLKDLNATQAAIRAGYSENTAAETGYENLRKPQIAAEIEKRQEKIGEQNEITVEWLLAEMKDTYIKAKEVGELSAANKTLEMLGRYKGIFNDKLKVDAVVTKKLEDFFA
ncbi:terminase small subunit [Paenibacillus macerans]|uniref:terminase small subunit n=1 Tax=Paenibacillus macerans TaxID=44252 RepID=UPI0020406909|nr:terminase small subunit [Paenibacillus macerans]MCM3703807.1 terminase small subunit [Paenibacillus macerans]